MLGRITLLACIAAFPCFLGLAAVAPAAIELAFGPEWSAAVPVVQVLALVGLLHVLFQGNHAVFKAKGRPDLSLKLAGLNAAANLALLLLVVRHGVLAVAVAYTLRAYLLAPVGLLMLRRLTGQDPLAHLRPLLPAAVAALVMASCVAGLIEWAGPRWSAATLLPAAIVAGAATYLLLLRCLAPQLVRELLAGGRALLSKQPTVVTAA